MNRKSISKILLVALGMGVSFHAAARQMPESSGGTGNPKPGRDGGKISANCLAGSSSSSLDINNVRATVLNGGDMWWDLFDPRYEVPKVTDPNAPRRHSLFAGAVWIGGKDPQENLYLATQTYRQFGQIGYWPGPLDQSSNISKDECSAWNYHSKINKADIEQFQIDFANGKFGSDERLLPQVIREWPGRNNPSLVQAGRNMNYELAPFVNVGGAVDSYEPLLGDYPLVEGDQGIWWVMNDAGGTKLPNSKVIGLEMQVMAFAFQTNNLINNMTFYKQILKNKGTNTLFQTYMGQWVDADLGFFNDDFVGCDVGRGLGICYNGDDNDEGPTGYGANPPSVGVDFFKGPLADENDGIDNDRDGTIDEVGERIIMSGFMYYNNDNNSTNGNPGTTIATDYYNYLRGIWRDGKQVTFGGDGTDQTKPPYKFMFPGTTDPKGYGFSNPPANPPVTPPFANWTENNRDGQNTRNTPADRRFLQSAGPFTLKSGSVNELTIGVVWAQANSGGARGSLGLLLNADDLAQRLFDNDFQLQQGPNAPELAITELDQQLILTLKPKAFKTSAGDAVTTESYFEIEKSLANDPNITDPYYRFEGYKVYQIKDPTVSASDLNNPDLARLVSQSDVKNGVTEIRNREFDITLNELVPKVKVVGNNQGLVHTINVTTDLFATGNDRIVNFKSYHYLVVAYAYNSEDANPEKYLEGRFSTKAVGIPHKPQVENGGTTLTSAYGTASKITRVFGTGNGGNVLEILPEDEQDILKENSKQLITYQAGHAPFVVKVYDPKKVKGGDFRVKLSSRLIYKKSSVLQGQINVGDIIVSTGDYSRPTSYNATTAKNKFSFPQVPGRAIVRRIITANPSEINAAVGETVTLDIEMLNDHLGGTFAPRVDVYETSSTANDLKSHIIETRPFKVENGTFEATSEQFFLNDFWKITMPDGTTVAADRPVSEFNEQLIPDYGIAIEFKQANNPGFQPKLNLRNGLQDGASSMLYSSSNIWLEGVPNGSNANANNPGLREVQWLLKLPVQGTPNAELTNLDPGQAFLNVLPGWAPYGVTDQGSNAASESPAYISTTGDKRKLYDIQNVDIVITSDKSKWTRVPVLQGNASGGIRLTKASSVLSVGKGGRDDKDGTMSLYPKADPSKRKRSVGMGWFPGYAIDLDKGIRLNMMFAEFASTSNVNSKDSTDKGRDLVWEVNSELNGGRNFVYIMKTKYDEGAQIGYVLDSLKYRLNPAGTAPFFNPTTISTPAQNLIFDNVTWVGNLRLPKPNSAFLSSDVRVKLRVDRAFMSYNPDETRYNVNNDNTPKTYVENSNPEYLFNTNSLTPAFDQVSVAKSGLDLVRVVPNPYYAVSQYEQRQLDNIVKITNLPRKCKISIYTINGTLIRTLNKDDNKTFIDWNLKNDKNIPIASGAYIVNVDAGNLGNIVLKWFGVIRPLDLDAF